MLLSTVEVPASDLSPSSVRVRPLLLSLISNNLAYARTGEILLPAWGYATVLESTTDIALGSTLWGFWPTSGLPTDLTLVPGKPSGHWIEVSEHRKQLMTYYNRYVAVSEDDWEQMAWTAAFRAIWGAGYLPSEYFFSRMLGQLVILSTARSLTSNLLCRPPGTGPLGVLQVTSVPETLEQAAEQRIAKHQLVTGPVKALAYSDVDQTVLWLARLEPSKLVVIDCDAPGDVLVQLRDLVQAHPEIQSAKFVIILVSGQQKVYTEADNRDWSTAIQQLGKIQSNASGAQDAAIEPDGPKEYFTRIHRRWEQWLDDRASTVPDRRLVWGKGVTGTEGLDGGWDRLTKGDVRPDEALVYMVYME
ncbi:uncharacterized protein BDW43DRAFT_307861 [Aspergillus alliaceus]|uniref:uncharacterized protein n=1 Tax=Petromyces alliaceus TaxID=209559 RepID=UPI0012A47BC2|nr:uncharacterized protein BDW43DRAFT_307861 [Aspergillus alliaceus]KAB8236846.1 hypothetical protein BDW43DRAFT_307861 [Aspergillus alliaceus]